MKRVTLSFFSSSRQVIKLSGNSLFTLIISLIIFLFLSGTVGAQDILIMKSGRQLKVSIIEESGDLIKYREYGDKAGPLYSVEKDMVAEIKYSRETLKVRDTKEVTKGQDNRPAGPSGTEKADTLTVKKRYVYRSGRLLSPRTVMNTMEENPEALKLYEAGRKQLNISNTCPFAVIVVSGVSSLTANRYKTQEEKLKILVPALAIDGALIVTGIVTAISGKNKIKKSVSLYNSSINTAKPLSCNLSVSVTKEGIGFKLQF